MRNIFGWSYPPGCSGPPEYPAICEVCGGDFEAGKCICPECPTCQEIGNPDCYKNHGLTISKEQTEQKEKYEKEEEAAAKAEAEAMAKDYEETERLIDEERKAKNGE